MENSSELQLTQRLLCNIRPL